eukprot:Rhum_TRINITY_DN14164_c29_g1::Rhum_TRINITY_DN14164_c29_g1_i1::g.69189::m.69189
MLSFSREVGEGGSMCVVKERRRSVTSTECALARPSPLVDQDARDHVCVHLARVPLNRVVRHEGIDDVAPPLSPDSLLPNGVGPGLDLDLKSKAVPLSAVRVFRHVGPSVVAVLDGRAEENLRRRVEELVLPVVRVRALEAALDVTVADRDLPALGGCGAGLQELPAAQDVKELVRRRAVVARVPLLERELLERRCLRRLDADAGPAHGQKVVGAPPLVHRSVGVAPRAEAAVHVVAQVVQQDRPLRQLRQQRRPAPAELRAQRRRRLRLRQRPPQAHHELPLAGLPRRVHLVLRPLRQPGQRHLALGEKRALSARHKRALVRVHLVPERVGLALHAEGHGRVRLARRQVEAQRQRRVGGPRAAQHRHLRRRRLEHPALAVRAPPRRRAHARRGLVDGVLLQPPQHHRALARTRGDALPQRHQHVRAAVDVEPPLRPDLPRPDGHVHRAVRHGPLEVHRAGRHLADLQRRHHHLRRVRRALAPRSPPALLGEPARAEDVRLTLLEPLHGDGGGGGGRGPGLAFGYQALLPGVHKHPLGAALLLAADRHVPEQVRHVGPLELHAVPRRRRALERHRLLGHAQGPGGERNGLARRGGCEAEAAERRSLVRRARAQAAVDQDGACRERVLLRGVAGHGDEAAVLVDEVPGSLPLFPHGDEHGGELLLVAGLGVLEYLMPLLLLLLL